MGQLVGRSLNVLLVNDNLRATSSAKSRSSSFVLNFHVITVFLSCNVLLISQSTTTCSRYSKADKLQLCVTPGLILNHSVGGFSEALSPYWQLFESLVCGGFAHFVAFVLRNVGY